MQNGNGFHHDKAPTMNGHSTIDEELTYRYLTPHARQSLLKFQYKGRDDSLLYAYILSPLAAFLVDKCTPKWMAPNTITLSGLMYMIFSYLLLWYYVPTLNARGQGNNTIPGWIFCYHGTAMLIYQTMDNMDGKQARRTGTSSPLGLLFDHGCDAINCIFGSANCIISLGLDPQEDALLCWLLILGPMAMFYISTWEEYYTGELLMPIVNGPNEGLLGGAILSFTTALYGTAFWQSTSWSNAIPWLPRVRNADIQLAITCLCIGQEIVFKSSKMARNYGFKALLNLSPLAMLFATTFLIGYLDVDVWLRVPRTSLHLCSGLFVEMTTQIMLDHITEENYRPIRWVYLPMILLIFQIGTEQITAGPYTDAFILFYALALWAYLLLKIKRVINEICTVLQIWCFDITTPRKPERKRL